MQDGRSPKRPRITYSATSKHVSTPIPVNGLYNVNFTPGICSYFDTNTHTPSKKRKRTSVSTQHMGRIIYQDEQDTIMSQIRIEIDDEKCELIAKRSSFLEHELHIYRLLGPRHPFILQPLCPQPDMSDYEGEWDDILIFEHADPITKAIGRMDALTFEDIEQEKLDARVNRIRQFLRQALGALSVCHSRFIVHNNISLKSAFLAGDDKNVKLCGLEHAIPFDSDQYKFRTLAKQDLCNFAIVVGELAIGRPVDSFDEIDSITLELASQNKQLMQLRKLIMDLYDCKMTTAEEALSHPFFRAPTRSKVLRESQLREKSKFILTTVENKKYTSVNIDPLDKENLPPSML